MRSCALLMALVAGANAESMSVDLKSLIREKMAGGLEAEAEAGVGGTTNCYFKCAALFNVDTIWKVTGAAELNNLEPGSPSAVLNEYIGCVRGCESCNGGVNSQCQKTCKNTNWYNMNWAYNPYSGYLNFVDCGAETNDLMKQQKACLDKINIPKTNGRAKLQKKFTKQTTACYNNPTFGIFAINSKCNAKCKQEATCTVYNRTNSFCTGNGDITTQYTEDMCGSGVLKNVIEPDKACIFGCVQNLCQKGSDCMGGEIWNKKSGYKHCQLITPQTSGEKYTIVPNIFNDNQNDIVGKCCSAARPCCGYLKGWTVSDGGKQRDGVCTVAQEECKGVFGNWKNLKPNKNEQYPGNACNAMWSPTGFCGTQDPKCPECLQY